MTHVLSENEIFITCLDYALFKGKLDNFKIEEKTVINTINQYSFCLAKNDAFFKESLLESDILLPDGVGMVAACKLLTGKNIDKIAGADLHFHLLEKLNRESGRCFYLGSSDTTLNKIKTRLAKEYPNIKVGLFSPPYKSLFSDEDSSSMVNAVNDFKPDVLFIGMTAPKQEKWVHAHKQKLDATIICSIGAVFDFYAGTVKRPGSIWINLGLEWAGRLFKEPKRMWKRYLYYGPVFFYYIVKQKLSR